MADADQSLEVLIKSVLDATGYRMNEAEAAKLKASLDDSRVGTDKLTEATKDSTQAADKSEISHRALHQILHLIGTEAGPGAAAALSGVAAAATGGMLFAVMGIRELISMISEARSEAAKFKEQIEQPIDLSGVKSDLTDVKKTIGDTRTETEKFFDSVRDKGAQDFKKFADEAIAHLTRLAEAEKKLLGKDDKAGADKAGADKIDADLSAKSLGVLHGAMMNTLLNEEGARRALAGAGDPKQAQRQMDTLARLLKAQQSKMADLEKAQTENTPGFWEDFVQRMPTFFPFRKASEQKHQQRAEEIGKAMNEARAQEAALRRQMDDLQKNGPSDEKIKAIQDSLTKLGSDKQAIQSEIDKRTDQQQIDQDTHTAAFTKQFLEAQARHGTGPGDTETIRAMNELLATSRQADQRMYNLLRELIAHHGDLAGALDGLNNDVRNIHSRIETFAK